MSTDYRDRTQGHPDAFHGRCKSFKRRLACRAVFILMVIGIHPSLKSRVQVFQGFAGELLEEGQSYSSEPSFNFPWGL